MPGYPTWEIRGALYPGEKSIDQLEAIAHGEVAPPPEFNGGEEAAATATTAAAATAAAGAGSGS